MSYTPATTWLVFGNIERLAWVCECERNHVLTAGKYVLTCPCGQRAGFDVDKPVGVQ